MPGIRYMKGDLFTAPIGSVLAQSCNCLGTWGKGVAAGFYKNFPSAYIKYKHYCENHEPEAIIGKCLLMASEATDPKGKGYFIACLFTSRGYGREADPKEEILQHTKTAIDDLIHQVNIDPRIESKIIHLPKINAGLFRVPWDQTEQILEDTHHPFVVYELN